VRDPDRSDPLRQWTALTHRRRIEVLGIGLSLASNHPGVLEWLVQRLGPHAASRGADFRMRLVVEADGPPAEEAVAPRHRQHGPIYAVETAYGMSAADLDAGNAAAFIRTWPAPARSASALLESPLLRYATRRGLVPIHAAGILTPQGPAVLRGVSGAGKSTLALAAALRGWPVLAEEVVWYDAGTGRRPTLRGIPHQIHLKALDGPLRDAVVAASGLRVDVADEATVGRPRSACTIALDPRRTATEVPAAGAALLFLPAPGPAANSRGAANGAAARRLTYAEARARFDAELLPGERATPPSRRNAAADALTAHGAYLLAPGTVSETLAAIEACLARRAPGGGPGDRS
jgi:hypothetical protein